MPTALKQESEILVQATKTALLVLGAALLLLLGLGIGTSLAFGLAEHLQGLNGPAAVFAAKVAFGVAAAAISGAGFVRIRRQFRLDRDGGKRQG